MNSNIDWNEIVPRLPKALRDSVWLEALELLSNMADAEYEAKMRLPTIAQKLRRAPATKKDNLVWVGKGIHHLREGTLVLCFAQLIKEQWVDNNGSNLGKRVPFTQAFCKKWNELNPQRKFEDWGNMSAHISRLVKKGILRWE